MKEEIKAILIEAGKSQANLTCMTTVDRLTNKIVAVVKRHPILKIKPHDYKGE